MQKISQKCSIGKHLENVVSSNEIKRMVLISIDKICAKIIRNVCLI